MGLFDIFKRNKTIQPEIIRFPMDEVDVDVKILNDALEKFKHDKNYDDVILTYESILIDKESYLFGTEHAIRLAEFYYADNQHDKAWGFLNKLYLEYMKNGIQHRIYKVRFIQHKILKKERKYCDALEMLMLSHMERYRPDNVFNRERFIKEAIPIFRKLGIYDDNDKINILCLIIEKQPCKHGFYEGSSLIIEYRKFIDKYNLRK